MTHYKNRNNFYTALKSVPNVSLYYIITDHFFIRQNMRYNIIFNL